jgi:hypothetical protein
MMVETMQDHARNGAKEKILLKQKVGAERFVDGRRPPKLFLNQLKSRTVELLCSCGRPPDEGT